MIKILEDERKRLKIENKNNLTEPIIKEQNEEFNNNTLDIIKRSNSFIVPEVERLIEMKPKINYKRKKPKNLQFGNNNILFRQTKRPVWEIFKYYIGIDDNFYLFLHLKIHLHCHFSFFYN